MKRNWDWVTFSWIVELLFFLFGGYLYIQALDTPKQGMVTHFYMGLSILFLLMTTINTFTAWGRLHKALGMIFILAYVFLIPLSYDAFGFPLGYTAVASLIFALATITFSPRLSTAITIVVFSAAFAGYLHHDKVILHKIPVFEKELDELEQKLASDQGELAEKALIRYYTLPQEMDLKTVSSLKSVYGDSNKARFLYLANRRKVSNQDTRMPAGTVLLIPKLPPEPQNRTWQIMLAYLCALGIGFSWKLLIKKLYQLYQVGMNSNMRQLQQQLKDSEQNLEKNKQNMRLLQEEIALQTIEMNKITGNTKK